MTTNRAIGGRAALDAAVERFHERISTDPELASQFEGLDMRRIIARQMALFAFVAAAPGPNVHSRPN